VHGRQVREVLTRGSNTGGGGNSANRQPREGAQFSGFSDDGLGSQWHVWWIVVFYS